MSFCSHPRAFIVESALWNGSEYEVQHYCSKCGRILKKENVRLGNNATKTQFVEQEMRPV